jgi:hypothetical protein
MELVERLLDARVTRVITDIRPNLHTIYPVAMRKNVGQIRVSMAGHGSDSK